MSRERLLVAKSVEVQLNLALTLLRKVVDNLATMRYGVEPSLGHARKALADAEKSYKCVEELVRHIPDR